MKENSLLHKEQIDNVKYLDILETVIVDEDVEKCHGVFKMSRSNRMFTKPTT